MDKDNENVCKKELPLFQLLKIEFELFLCLSLLCMQYIKLLFRLKKSPDDLLILLILLILLVFSLILVSQLLLSY